MSKGNAKKSQGRVVLRFGLKALFVTQLLAAFGLWWYATWPDRTARKFIGLIESGRTEEAKKVYGSKDTAERLHSELADIAKTVGSPALTDLWVQQDLDPPRFESQSFRDWRFARRRFSITRFSDDQWVYFGTFVAVRGVVFQLDKRPYHANSISRSFPEDLAKSQIQSLSHAIRPKYPMQIEIISSPSMQKEGYFKVYGPRPIIVKILGPRSEATRVNDALELVDPSVHETWRTRED